MASSNLDHAIDALALIRKAQRATDAALRLPASDRAAVAGQIEAVRGNVDAVASSLAGSVPGGRSLADAGHALGSRPELRALGGMVGFFAGQGSQALDAVAGAATSLGGERDLSLVLSERIRTRLASVGVATRDDLASALEVNPGSADFRDALERTLGTGLAEWYGSGTYGLPREELEEMLARARMVASEEAGAETARTGEGAAEAPAEPSEPGAQASYGMGQAVDDLRGSVDALWSVVARRGGGVPPADATPGSVD